MGRVFTCFDDWISSLGKFRSLTDWPRNSAGPSQGLLALLWPDSTVEAPCRAGLGVGLCSLSGLSGLLCLGVAGPVGWTLFFREDPVGNRAGSVFLADICCRFWKQQGFSPPDAEELTNCWQEYGPFFWCKVNKPHLAPLLSSGSPCIRSEKPFPDLSIVASTVPSFSLTSSYKGGNPEIGK